MRSRGIASINHGPEDITNMVSALQFPVEETELRKIKRVNLFSL